MPRIFRTFIFVLASLPLLSQQPSTPAKPPSDLASVRTQADLDAVLAKRRLQECETNLQKWNDWRTNNKDALDEYEKNSGSCIEVVQSSKVEARIQTAIGYFSFAAGIVVSLFLIWRIGLAVRRFFQKRPFTPEKKQLVALIIASLWASGAVVFSLNEPDLTRHPVNLLATVFVLSLPAMLFGGVSFWWFEKAKESKSAAVAAK
jgi:hypothetical protein